MSFFFCVLFLFSSVILFYKLFLFFFILLLIIFQITIKFINHPFINEIEIIGGAF